MATVTTDWAQTHPARGKVDPLNVESAEDLSREQIIELIQAFSGLRGISNKISKLEQGMRVVSPFVDNSHRVF